LNASSENSKEEDVEMDGAQSGREEGKIREDSITPKKPVYRSFGNKSSDMNIEDPIQNGQFDGLSRRGQRLIGVEASSSEQR
jgi:hypothetical protein